MISVTGPDGRTAEGPDGHRLTFGRAGTATVVDFPLTSSAHCSRVAGHLTAQPGQVTVVSGQQQGNGAVRVLTVGGELLATLDHGGEVVCRRPQFRVRLVVNDRVFDLQVRQQPAATEPTPASRGETPADATHVSTDWSLRSLLSPTTDTSWRSAVALACALQRYGSPGKGLYQGTPPPATALRAAWITLYGEQRDPSFFTRAWVRASSAFGLPTAPKAVKIGPVVTAATTAGYLDEQTLFTIWNKLGDG